MTETTYQAARSEGGDENMSVEPSPNPWRETVRAIYDELHFGEDSVFGGAGLSLAHRLIGLIEQRHHDYFCEGVAITSKSGDGTT